MAMTPPELNDPTVPRIPATSPPHRPTARLAALAAGLLAAGIGWGAGELTAHRYEEALAKTVGSPLVPGSMPSPEVGDRASVSDAATTYGIQGATLGLLLGLAGAIGGGATRRATWAGPLGLVLGGGLSALAATGAFAAFHRAMASHGGDDLLLSMAAHAATWATVGGIGGLAFGLGLGGGRGPAVRAAVGGLFGGVLGAVIYEIGGAALMPLDKTGDPVAASSLARLLGHIPVALLSALGASLAAQPAPARARTAAPARPDAPA